MKNCKSCGYSMEDSSKFCPECGCPAVESTIDAVPQLRQDNSDLSFAAEEIAAEKGEKATKKEAGKSKNGLIALSAAMVILAAAIIIALIVTGSRKTDSAANSTEPEQTAPLASAEMTAATQPVETTEATIPADGNPNDVTCKGTYTADAAALQSSAADIVATAGTLELTNGDLQLYYQMEIRNFLNNYGAYASYFGLDVSQELDTQICLADETKTWQQYFLDAALTTWHEHNALCDAGKTAGHQLDAELQQTLDSIEADTLAAAKENGFEDLDAFISSNLGEHITFDNYRQFVDVYYHGYDYYNTMRDGFQVTDEQVEQEFTARETEYAENGITRDTCTVDVRHVLIQPEDTNSDAAWEEAKQKAQELLDTWAANDGTEEGFSALAQEHSTDPGSNTNGGLYEGVTEGQMVDTFNDWCFDSDRKCGDYGLVETTYGYHLMYFVNSAPVWQEYVRSDMLEDMAAAFVNQTLEKYPMNVDYSKILLAKVEIS